MAEFNALRPITYRLNSTPVEELPRIACVLASSISTCGQALQTNPTYAATQNNDNVVLVHKLKTRISSLLQERSLEGRFTAVVLVKAVVEAGGREILSSSESWVRSLLAILGKRDSVSTKKLCLIAITRIFSLTLQYPTLVRELTTPLLPTFITACLNLIKPNMIHTDDGTATVLSPFLEPVFGCLSELLPNHPTIFRPFAARLNPIALSLIGDTSAPRVISDVASNIVATLHFSASKNSGGAEWSQSCKSIISACHMATDEVFRCVMEDWEPSEKIESSFSVAKGYESKVQASGPDALGLPAWVGLHNGIKRLIRLLRLLMKLLSCHTPPQISCPIGSIIDLTARLSAVTAIADSKVSQFSMRLNAEIGRDERDELWMELPTLHTAVLELLSTIIDSFAESTLPIARIIFGQMLNVFEAEQRNDALRNAAYWLTNQLLSLLGFSLARSDVDMLSTVVKRCCADLVLQAEAETNTVNTVSTKPNGHRPGGSVTTDADSFVNQQRDSTHSNPSGKQAAVYCAAFELLPSFLSTLSAGAMPHSLRTEIDRTAILVQNRSALLASVLNPPLANKGQRAPPSVMPFLARASSGEVDIEGLLRPRMPLIRNDTVHTDSYANILDEEDSDSQAADHASAMDEDQDKELPEGLDLLDRLEHSLDTSPVATKHNVDGLEVKQILATSSESSAYQYLFESNTKRDLAAMNGEGAEQDPKIGAPSIPGSHLASGSSITDINKRQRLENDPRMLASDNWANVHSIDAPGLHEPEIRMATGSSSLPISTQGQEKNGTETLSNSFGQSTAPIQNEADDSDSEIPEIIDSSSEGDEE